MPNFVGRKLGHKCAGVGHPADETLSLERNQRFANDRRAHFHLPRQLPLHDGIAWLELAGEKSVLKRVDHAVAERKWLNFGKGGHIPSKCCGARSFIIAAPGVLATLY